MKFNTLAWSAVCFYCRSAGEKIYGYLSISTKRKMLEESKILVREVVEDISFALLYSIELEERRE